MKQNGWGVGLVVWWETRGFTGACSWCGKVNSYNLLRKEEWNGIAFRNTMWPWVGMQSLAPRSGRFQGLSRTMQNLGHMATQVFRDWKERLDLRSEVSVLCQKGQLLRYQWLGSRSLREWQLTYLTLRWSTPKQRFFIRPRLSIVMGPMGSLFCVPDEDK